MTNTYNDILEVERETADGIPLIPILPKGKYRTIK